MHSMSEKKEVCVFLYSIGFLNDFMDDVIQINNYLT